MGTFDMNTFLDPKNQYMSGQASQNIQNQIQNANQDLETQNQQTARNAGEAQRQAMSSGPGMGDPSVSGAQGAAISRRAQQAYNQGTGDIQRTMQVNAPMQRIQRMSQGAHAGMAQEQANYSAMVNQQKFDLYNEQRQNNIFGSIFGAIGSAIGFAGKLIGGG